MKVTFTDKYAPREGDEVEVTEAAGQRLIDSGWVTKARGKSTTEDDKPAAKKAPAKKAARKS